MTFARSVLMIYHKSSLIIGYHLFDTSENNFFCKAGHLEVFDRVRQKSLISLLISFSICLFPKFLFNYLSYFLTGNIDCHQASFTSTNYDVRYSFIFSRKPFLRSLMNYSLLVYNISIHMSLTSHLLILSFWKTFRQSLITNVIWDCLKRVQSVMDVWAVDICCWFQVSGVGSTVGHFIFVLSNVRWIITREGLLSDSLR